MIAAKLSAPQHIFLNELNTKFRAYVGGYGSGKTYVGCLDQLLFAQKHNTTQGYFGPTYPSIVDIYYPTMDEAAESLGISIRIKEAKKEVVLFRRNISIGRIICRSMDRPEAIVGFKIARALVDEIDTMSTSKAVRAWNKIIARMRLVIDGVENIVCVTCTPEGFVFVYQKFKHKPTTSYSMVQASTYENEENLPTGYIESLRETYPAALCNAYLKGQFVNLTSGTVYCSYNREKNRSTEAIKSNEPLRIGMDFNVTNMSAVVYVLRDKIWHAVDELSGIYDTPAMITTIKERYHGHNIRVYPDSTGDRRKSVDASTSDIALLEQAKFVVYYNRSKKTGGGFNIRVKDRVISSNAAFENQRVMINSAKCPETAKCLEQLAYDKNGEPDKSSNLDHLPDAATYPVAFEMPISRPPSNLKVKFAR